jgi:hypothetical protein
VHLSAEICRFFCREVHTLCRNLQISFCTSLQKSVDFSAERCTLSAESLSFLQKYRFLQKFIFLQKGRRGTLSAEIAEIYISS